MPRVLVLASVLGIFGVLESFGLFWLVRDHLGLPPEVVQSAIFLKLLVSGHMTIYITRTRGAVWERPWPSWKLVVPCEVTQVLGTLAAVYGLFMAPIGWGLALMVWAYSLTFFAVACLVKLAVAHRLDTLPRRHADHLARIERHAGAQG
jgi:H+-transporting ATPase